MSQEIKSWNNGIVEDQAGSTLPTVHAEDNGKVLQVVEGQWQKGDKLPSPELPTPSADNSGKIAKVVSNGEGGYIWGAENETSELPAPKSDNAGKIAKVVEDGEGGYIWSAEEETRELPVPNTNKNDCIAVIKNGKWSFTVSKGISSFDCLQYVTSWGSGSSVSLTNKQFRDTFALTNKFCRCTYLDTISATEITLSLTAVDNSNNYYFSAVVPSATGLTLYSLKMTVGVNDDDYPTVEFKSADITTT